MKINHTHHKGNRAGERGFWIYLLFTSSMFITMLPLTQNKMNAICGDGMCPYVPCKDCPNCVHVEDLKKLENEKTNNIRGKGERPANKEFNLII